MPRGLNRTVIMSHGRNHDALGVKGTHMAGTTPEPAVLDAIPTAIGAVGNVPEAQVPVASVPATLSNKPRVDAEGDRVLPGGSRDGGPSTQRPSAAVTSPEAPQAPPQPRSKAIPPPPAVAPAPSQDAISPVAALAASLNKRKLKRASVRELTEWCRIAKINPREYVESDEEPITGTLMRRLLVETFNIE